MTNTPAELVRLSTRVSAETKRDAQLHAARRGEDLQTYVNRAIAKENQLHARRNA
jgi:predicted HicB family RNase H-like nuclease